MENMHNLFLIDQVWLFHTKKWLLKNHPDKGGDVNTELFKNVTKDSTAISIFQTKIMN